MSKAHFEKVVGYFLLDTSFKQQAIDKRQDLGTPLGCVLQIFCSFRLPQKMQKASKKPLLGSSQKHIPHKHSPSIKKAAFGVVLRAD